MTTGSSPHPMSPCPWSVDRLLPHAAPMLLIDSVTGSSEDAAETEVTLRQDHILAQPEGIPAHIGIELMAQSCGCHIGIKAMQRNEPIRPGFLLGTRRYDAAADWLLPGDRLRVHARVVFLEDTMGVYDCTLHRNGSPFATAQLTVYQPQQTDHMLEARKGSE